MWIESPYKTMLCVRSGNELAATIVQQIIGGAIPTTIEITIDGAPMDCLPRSWSKVLIGALAK